MLLDPPEPIVRLLIDEWPQVKAPRVTEILREDYGYGGWTFVSWHEEPCGWCVPALISLGRVTEID